MKRILSTICIFAALFASCTNEELPEASVGTNDNTNLVPMEFSVSGETNRTALQSDKSVHWESTDVISVLDGTNNNEFTTTDSGASATFKGEAAEVETYYAVYPYSEKNALIAEDAITLRFPHEQLASEAAAPSIHNVLVGKSETKSFVMKNVGGLVYFSMNSSNITSVTLRGNNQEWIAGDATITLDEMGTPTIAKGATGFIYDKITLTPKGATFTSGKTYYIAVPAGVEFSGGINLTFTNTDGLSATLTGSNPLTIGRSQTHNLQAIDTESLNWELQIPLEFIFYNTKPEDLTVADYWPFNEDIKSIDPSIENTFTTINGNYAFNVYAEDGTKYSAAEDEKNYTTYSKKNMGVATSNGQGFKLGSSANDYFEFPCPEGWSLYKVVMETGAYSNGTKGNIDLVGADGVAVGETFAATTAEGTRHTWTVETPVEQAYKLKHGDSEKLTMRKLYLYYMETSEVPVVKQTKEISVDFTAEEPITSWGITTTGPSEENIGKEVSYTYNGYSYALYTDYEQGYRTRVGSDDQVMGLAFNYNLSKAGAENPNYSYLALPVIEGYHLSNITTEWYWVNKTTQPTTKFEIAAVGAETPLSASETSGTSNKETISLSYDETQTNSTTRYCVRSKHRRATLVTLNITYTED